MRGRENKRKMSPPEGPFLPPGPPFPTQRKDAWHLPTQGPRPRFLHPSLHSLTHSLREHHQGLACSPLEPPELRPQLHTHLPETARGWGHLSLPEPIRQRR